MFPSVPYTEKVSTGHEGYCVGLLSHALHMGPSVRPGGLASCHSKWHRRTLSNFLKDQDRMNEKPEKRAVHDVGLNH